MPTPTPTPAPPLPPAPPLSASPPLPMLPQIPSPPPPVGVIGSYLPPPPPPPPYVIPGFPPPIAPPLPLALPPPAQEPGVIQVRIDNEWVPIQSGASGSHTTAWISVSDLQPGTYTIYFHGRRSDQSEVIVPITLIVEDPVQGVWGLPQITTSSLPAGYVGKEYSDLKYATLTTGSDDKANQLKFTAVIGGATGNSITITYSVTKDGETVVPSKPLLVSVSGLNITVNLATNSLGGVISTSENVKNAIRNNTSASALVTVTVIGNPIGTVETLTQTPLAGGAAATTLLEADPPDAVGTWSVTPGLYGTSGLPPGLSFDAATGAVFGIPTQVGEYVVSFHLTDSQGYQVTRQIPLTIFPDRPAAEVLPTETRSLGSEIYPDEPVISGSLVTPLPDQVSQDLLSLRDLKRSFWSPVPLTDTLISDGEIISPVAISGQLSTAVIQFEPPVGPGPWVEVRFSFYSYKDPANPDDIKIVLAVIPMSGGVALRDTVEKTTLPLDADSTYLHQFVWRGLWFRPELESLAIRFEPRSSLPAQNDLLGANKVRFSGVTATLRSVPLPDVSLVASILLSGKPVSAVQLTPYLSDAFETYELTWLGHWDQNELEEISLVLETRVKSEEMDSDAAIPWIMVSSVELEASPEPPPVVPVTPGEILNLLTVTVVPSGAADLDGYVFLVNIKSNGYDGWVIPSLSWVNTNPGINAVFSEDRFSITNGEIKQVQLTVTNVSAAIGSVAYFVVLMAASTGIGSGSSGPISFIVADAPPSALPLPPSSSGSTRFFVDLIPTVAEIPTYGFTSFAVKVTAPLGTTTVALSASARPFLSSVQAAFTASVVQPAPGYPVATQLQVQVVGVPEQTYSIDILGVGSDGGYAVAQAVLVVKGQPVAPVPLPPPLPVSPPLAYPNIVETLVPDGTINQTGTLSGNWPDINSGVGDSADDSTYVQFLFGPSPLTGVAAVNYSMTDPVADGIWTQIILRARLRILTNVQNPTFSFQPYVNDLPVGAAKTISIQDGLSINLQNFAWTWQGQWTTNELRTLMVQVSAYTTGSQVELNEIVLTELDAVISGNLRNPLPVSVPVHLAPNSLGTTSGASWGYSTLNLISAVNQDTDCATDLDYATIDLVSGGNSHQEFNFEDPPIEGSWRDITVRVRAQATGGQPQIEIDFTIRGATVIGSVVPITGEDWVTYRAVYAGTYDNSDISGMTVNVKLSNIGGGSSEVLVSGVDIVVQGVAAALEQIKIVPFYELQFYGSHHGSIADIWEGLVWPPDASTDPNLPLVAAGDFITSPDPLPKEYDPEEVDLDYEVFPLNYDQRSTIIEYGFSDPVPIPSLSLPSGSPPLPSLPPGPPPVVMTLAIKDASLLLPPSPLGSPPTVPGDLSIKDADLLLPPSPPGSPPIVPGELLIRTASMLPPLPPAVEQYFTSVTVRMRLHQDPRIGPPAIINIPPEPPFTLVEPAPLSLPPAPVDQLFPFSGHPLQFQVTGGTPPYTWTTYIAETIVGVLAGVPPGITAEQNIGDSSFFDYIGTPNTVGIYKFGIRVLDFKGRGIAWALTHDIVAPGPPPTPPPPGPPPGPVSPPVIPPTPPSPPLAPPVPDMFLWIDNYTTGINPFEDPTTDWVGPDVDINSLPPSDLNHVNVSQVQFETPTQTIELSGGDLSELAHLTRSGLTWTTVVFSNRGLGFGPVVTIKGATSADPAPIGITHDATIPFTVVLTFNGVAGLPESGSVELSVTGVPNALNQPSPPGGASGTIYWAFLSPLVILTSHLPDVVVGSAYSETLAAQGGTQPYTWYLTSSTNSELPPGITLSTDGKLTGKPYQVGNYVFQVAVFDSKRQITTANLSINVTPPLPLPPPPPPPLIPSPPPSPGLPPGPSPAPPGPPGPPIFVIEEVPGIEVRFQPLVPGKCSGTIAGLGSTVINDFLIPRPSTGSTAPVSAGPWKDFSQTWFGFWTSEQLSELMVEVQISLVEPISVGAQNNLYISALDVVVTKAVPPSMAPWLASMRPEGRIKWMSTRLPDETGMNSGKWFDQDTLTWQGAGTSYMNSILGTAHKGGATQEAADALLERFEILGWLDRDGSGTANAGDTPDFSGYVALATGIGTLDTTILVTNISGLKDSLGKYFLGFLIDDELVVVQRDQIDYETGLLHNVWRGVNETREASHAKGTLVFPVNFWELMYQIKVAGASGPDFQGQSVGWDASSGNDDGTPGELLQSGPLDLRPFSGEHPIRWLLRLRAFDIYGLNTDSNMDLPGYPDEFKSTGPGAYMGPEGNVYVPTKRLLYVKQIRPPGKPNISNRGV